MSNQGQALDRESIPEPGHRKRVSRLNPSNEWITKGVPALRIISDELWETAKDRAYRGSPQ
jgi:hypothetical protein